MASLITELASPEASGEADPGIVQTYKAQLQALGYSPSLTGKCIRQRIVMPHWTTWCPQAPPAERSFDVDDLQLLRVDEVANRLGVSVATVYRLVRRRGLPGPLPLTGRARRWIAWEVTQWMNSCVAVSLRISGELPSRASRRKERRQDSEDRPRH